MTKAVLKKRQIAILSTLALTPFTVATAPAASANKPEGATFEFRNEVIVKKADGSEDPETLGKISEHKDFDYTWECQLPDNTKQNGDFSLTKGNQTNSTDRLLTGSQCTISESNGAENYLDNNYTYELQLVTGSGTQSKIERVSANKFSFTISQPGSNDFILKNVYTPKAGNGSMKDLPQPGPRPEPVPRPAPNPKPEPQPVPPAPRPSPMPPKSDPQPLPIPQPPSRPQPQPRPTPDQPKQESKPKPRPEPQKPENKNNSNNSTQPKDRMSQKNPGTRSKGFSLAWILAPLALLLAAIGAGYLHWFHR